VEAGFDLNLTPNMILGLTYGGQFGSGLTDQTVRGNFSIKF
jgi:fibronectin-binding autotransporter adhesin